MAFLKSGLLAETTPVIRGHTLYLRPPVIADYSAWAAMRARSRDHLTPFEPTWARDELTKPAFRRRIRYHQREQREDQGISFLIFSTEDDALMGGLTMSNIRRGVTQAVTFGYWMGAPYAGQGNMTEAVGAATTFALDELRLHRVEAACLPHNTASIRVLERNGFTREGLARRYLCIDGQWQDHILFAILAEDPRPPKEGAR